MTDVYDPGSDQHLAIKRELMHGIALKDIATFGEVNRALATAGFEVVESEDLAAHEHRRDTPWYLPMETMRGLPGSAFHRIPMGRKALRWGSPDGRVLRCVPEGLGGGDCAHGSDRKRLCRGGRAGIFTPLYCFVARRPLSG